jgi:hypothetical protein
MIIVEGGRSRVVSDHITVSPAFMLPLAQVIKILFYAAPQET